ncbi:AfsR/SARP family transcriptional regulator [Glycomyces tenuis]|uniref:AfsR/SARP family transcriptional regulator n=1 Tax=Glycomyces tenuis TaxID=58116 RepID=UPI0004011131|nr:AfsR/SARP family transcriptional regulator [Glycomyces tenuis]
MAAYLEFRVLGPLGLLLDGEPGPALPPMQRRLLAVLLARGGRQLTSGELADAVWSGTPPPSAERTLQVHLHRLRRALGDPTRISRGEAGYLIDVAADELDAARFERLLATARRERAAAPAAAVDTLRRALELWRGDAYVGVDASGMVAAEARRLESLRLDAQQELHELQLDLGHHEEAVGPLTELAAAQPYRERLTALLMLALYRSGRQAESLRLFRDNRRRLVDELGIEPGKLLRRIHDAVLQADERLFAVVTADLDGDWAPAAPALQRPRTPVPRELPQPPHLLTGRDREMEALEGLLGHATPIALIVGMSGIGKTALAVHWGHKVADRFPDGHLFIDLRGHGDAALSPLEALTAMLGALGVPPGQVPPEPDRAAARFRSQVGDRRMLIVLDNAGSGDQVRPLLPAGPDCLTLVTSRHRLTDLVVLNGAKRISLAPLAPEAARSLLAEFVPPGVGEADLNELAGLCGRLPLALQIAAAKLADHHDPASYRLMLAEGNRLAALEVDGSPDAAIRAVFDSAYRGLPDDSRRLFRILGLMPGPDCTAEAAARLADRPVADTERILEQLAAVHLLEHHHPGRYRFHDLLRLYAEERARSEEPSGARGAAERRLFDWYLERADESRRLLYPELTAIEPPADGSRPRLEPEEADAWMTPERDNLIAVLRRAAEDGGVGPAWRLFDALAGLVWLGVHTAELLHIGEAVLAAAERDGDPLGRAATEIGLAWGLISANHAAEAVEHGEAGAELAAEAGSPRALAAADHLLALGYASIGRPRVALGHVQAALRTARELGHPVLERENLEAMAGINLQLGALETAVALLQEELRLTGGEGVPATVTMYGNLASAYLLQGRLDRAQECFGGLASAGGRDFTAPAPATDARVRVRLLLATGRPGEALEVAAEAVEGLGEHPQRIREATVVGLLAAAHHANGEYAEAVARYERVIDLTDQGWHYMRVDALLGRAGSLLRLGDIDGARKGAESTIAASRASGYGVLEGLALNLFAEIALAEADPRSAIAHAAAALRSHRETGHRPGAAAALRLLGKAHDGVGDVERAARLHDEATACYAEMGLTEPR